MRWPCGPFRQGDGRSRRARLVACLYLCSLLLGFLGGASPVAAADPLSVLEICTGKGGVTRLGEHGSPRPAQGHVHEHCPGCLPGCGKIPAALAAILDVPVPELDPQPAPAVPTSGPALPRTARLKPPARGPPFLV